MGRMVLFFAALPVMLACDLCLAFAVDPGPNAVGAPSSNDPPKKAGWNFPGAPYIEAFWKPHPSATKKLFGPPG